VSLAAQQILAGEKINARVVSMPCWEFFDQQPEDYREAVLPHSVRARVAVEAGATSAWGRYLGLDGATVGLDRFGASAPYQVLYQKLGITAEAVAETARAVLRRVK
jgi:transketolase